MGAGRGDVEGVGEGVGEGGMGTRKNIDEVWGRYECE